MPFLNQSIKFLFNRYVRTFDIALASGIPLRSIQRYKKTGLIPAGTNFNKIMKLYRETQYRSMRVQGASVHVAKKYWSQSPSAVNTIKNKYAESIIRIAAENEVDLDLVRENMAESEKEEDEIFESGL